LVFLGTKGPFFEGQTPFARWAADERDSIDVERYKINNCIFTKQRKK